MVSKNGPPTVMDEPFTASTNRGKTVPKQHDEGKNGRKAGCWPGRRPRTDTGSLIDPGLWSWSPRQARRPMQKWRPQGRKRRARPGPPPVIGEGVHRHEDPGPGEERPQDGEAEGGEEKREVPDPQHGSPLLDHGRVQKGGRRQPGQQGGVFDRVPGPVAPPTEDLVAPPGTEDDAGGEARPGENGPTAGLATASLPPSARLSSWRRRGRRGW